ncbi:hypothetical protein GCM10022239_03420 [Leifsonia bigeumensis]|uniref:Rho termination factor N-terminal domain-containing protein n=1 Tax=Leifsonella bigeumensis TaxID=433643 RepID=A0ABP7F4D0_9MICO
MRIIHPRPAQGRQKFIGVEFVDGFARVDSLDPIIEQTLLQHRFVIEQEPTVDLEALTVKELREIADVEGVAVPARASKADLVDLLSRTPAGTGPDGEPFGIAELADGTVIGDGESPATIPADERTAED